MKKLAVLDTEKNEVHIYTIDSETEVDADRIESLGHNTNNCWWLFAEDIKVIEHQEILT